MVWYHMSGMMYGIMYGMVSCIVSCMVSCMVYGVWYMVHGIWYTVYGIVSYGIYHKWYMISIHGTWSSMIVYGSMILVVIL